MIFAGFEFFVVSAVASAGDGVDMRALDTYIEWTERDPAGWPDELLRCVGQFFCQLTTRSAASAGKSPFGSGFSPVAGPRHQALARKSMREAKCALVSSRL